MHAKLCQSPGIDNCGIEKPEEYWHSNPSNLKLSSIVTSVLVGKINCIHLVVVVNRNLWGRHVNMVLITKKLGYISAIGICNLRTPTLLVGKISCLWCNFMNRTHEPYQIVVLP